MPALPDNWLGVIGAGAVLIVVAWALDRLTYRVFRGAIRRMAARTKSTWDDRIMERKVFSPLAHAVPAVVVYYGIGPALGVSQAAIVAGADWLAFTAGLTQRVALAFIVTTMVMAATAALDAVNNIYNESYAESKSRPIKGYLQVIGLVLYIATGIVVVSILADRSPLVFISGFGALTAVLMLVFRDTILSLVASLQIMSNDMIRIGGLGRDAAGEHGRGRHRHRAAYREDPELGHDDLHDSHAQVHQRVVQELAGDERVRRPAHQAIAPPRHVLDRLPHRGGDRVALALRATEGVHEGEGTRARGAPRREERRAGG